MNNFVQQIESSYYPYPLPSYEEIKTFMEHGSSEELDFSKHLDVRPVPGDVYDEDRIFQSTPSPPGHRDLVELLSAAYG